MDPKCQFNLPKKAFRNAPNFRSIGVSLSIILQNWEKCGQILFVQSTGNIVVINLWLH